MEIGSFQTMQDEKKRNENKSDSASIIVKECFWGDYSITPEKILKRLEEGDFRFKVFIFSKIVENSLYPSKHLRNLFDREELATLFERYPKSSDYRRNQRLRIIKANLFGIQESIPEYSWKK